MMKLRYALPVLFLCFSLCQVRAGTIHDAVRLGDLEAVARILDADPGRLQATDTVGYTPLHFAAAYARWDILAFLLDRGAPLNIEAMDRCTPLHCASMYDEPEAIELLLENGADSSMTGRDVYGEYTPLLRASQRGCGGVIELLLARGADPEATTKEGWTALHLAALCGHGTLFDILIEGGVPGDAKDGEGKTYRECLLVRPDRIPVDPRSFGEYAGEYGPFVAIFIEDGRLWLDDHSLNELYPTGKDTFFCGRDPWKAVFRRNAEGAVDGVELIFLRRSVFVDKSG